MSASLWISSIVTEPSMKIHDQLGLPVFLGVDVPGNELGPAERVFIPPKMHDEPRFP
jgi:hypothetical protein